MLPFRRLILPFLALLWFAAGNHCLIEDLVFESKTASGMPCPVPCDDSAGAHKHGQQCNLVFATLSSPEQIGVKALDTITPPVIPLLLYALASSRIEDQFQVTFADLRYDAVPKQHPFISLSIAQNAPPSHEIA